MEAFVRNRNASLQAAEPGQASDGERAARHALAESLKLPVRALHREKAKQVERDGASDVNKPDVSAANRSPTMQEHGKDQGLAGDVVSGSITYQHPEPDHQEFQFNHRSFNGTPDVLSSEGMDDEEFVRRMEAENTARDLFDNEPLNYSRRYREEDLESYPTTTDGQPDETTTLPNPPEPTVRLNSRLDNRDVASWQRPSGIISFEQQRREQAMLQKQSLAHEYRERELERQRNQREPSPARESRYVSHDRGFSRPHEQRNIGLHRKKSPSVRFSAYTENSSHQPRLSQPILAPLPYNAASLASLSGLTDEPREVVDRPRNNIVHPASPISPLPRDLNFSSLEAEPFDVNVKAAQASLLPKDKLSASLAIKLEHVSKLDQNDQQRFFNALSIEQWDEAGDWFNTKFNELTSRLVESRKERRKLARQFESEIAQQHESVEREKQSFDKILGDMKINGGAFLQQSTPKRKRSAHSTMSP